MIYKIILNIIISINIFIYGLENDVEGGDLFIE